MMGKATKLGYMRQVSFLRSITRSLSRMYRALSPVARCLLEELHSFYLPGKRGGISPPGWREAYSRSSGYCRQSFSQLQRLGFIVLVQGRCGSRSDPVNGDSPLNPIKGESRLMNGDWEIPEPKRRSRCPKAGQSNLIVLARLMN